MKIHYLISILLCADVLINAQSNNYIFMIVFYDFYYFSLNFIDIIYEQRPTVPTPGAVQRPSAPALLAAPRPFGQTLLAAQRPSAQTPSAAQRPSAPTPATNQRPSAPTLTSHLRPNGLSSSAAAVQNSESFICQQDGLFKDPARCDKFYQCSNGALFSMKCPSRTFFDPSLNKCNWLKNVQC